MKNRLLHNEKGAAVLYADGFSVYALNGVRVTKELVETPSNKLDPKLVTTEKNAEIRREIVRKIGVDRVYQKLGGKTINRLGEMYELITLNIGDNRIRPYLKMRNPSLGTYHLEGVPREIKTVREALNWRNQSEEEPIVLT